LTYFRSAGHHVRRSPSLQRPPWTWVRRLLRYYGPLRLLTSVSGASLFARASIPDPASLFAPVDADASPRAGVFYTGCPHPVSSQSGECQTSRVPDPPFLNHALLSDPGGLHWTTVSQSSGCGLPFVGQRRRPQPYAHFVALSHGLVHRSVQLRAQVAPVVHVDFASAPPTGFGRVGFALRLTHWVTTMGFIPAFAGLIPPSRA
jgi:hypothetical protein